MFLVDSSQAAADWDRMLAAIRNILERAEAEIVSLEKWDERMLAYDIRRRSRGTYILCYFRSDGNKNRQVERDVQLSEEIMRVLILRADHVTPEDLDKDTATEQMEACEKGPEAGGERMSSEPEEPKADQEVQEVAADVSVEQPEAEIADERPGEPGGEDAEVDRPSE
jgi:small subunit ribosomal protein S6